MNTLDVELLVIILLFSFELTLKKKYLVQRTCLDYSGNILVFCLITFSIRLQLCYRIKFTLAAFMLTFSVSLSKLDWLLKMLQISQRLVFLASSIPRIHVNACCTTISALKTVNPILPVPYLQFLVAWHRQLLGKIAENELWRCVANSIKTVKMCFLVTITVCFQVSSRWQNGFFIGICDDSQ